MHIWVWIQLATFSDVSTFQCFNCGKTSMKQLVNNISGNKITLKMIILLNICTIFLIFLFGLLLILTCNIVSTDGVLWIFYNFNWERLILKKNGHVLYLICNQMNWYQIELNQNWNQYVSRACELKLNYEIWNTQPYSWSSDLFPPSRRPWKDQEWPESWKIMKISHVQFLAQINLLAS